MDSSRGNTLPRTDLAAALDDDDLTEETSAKAVPIGVDARKRIRATRQAETDNPAPAGTARQYTSNARYRLDNLEKAIISLLCQDGRMPFQSIARELAVDEKTVRNRIAKLREMGVLNFLPVADANAMKGCIVAMIAVCVNTDVRHDIHRLAEDVAALPMVSWVGAVMGQYDMMLEVVVDSWEELVRFELEELPQIKGVGRTDSFLVISHYGRRGVPFVNNILQPR